MKSGMLGAVRIALATCSNLPGWEMDDQPLHEAFAERGVWVDRPAWDNPSVDWTRYDACLIRTTWDYMERREKYLAWADHVEQATRLFNSASTVRWNTHKSYLRDLEAKGAPLTPTIWIDADDGFNLRDALNERGWRRGFLKPVVGATARETMRFHTDREEELQAAERHLDRLCANGESMLLQPYLASVEQAGEISAIFIDGQITHTVRKVPVPGDYRVQDDFGAHDEPTTFTCAELALASDIVDMIEDDLLYARVDFLRDDEGNLCLSELELVEPSLFFRHGSHAAERLAEALIERVRA